MKIAEIPGYAEAVAAEREAREIAFVARGEWLCGVWIRAITLGDFVALSNMGNRFVIGGNPDGVDAAKFLWFMREDFRPCPVAPDSFFYPAWKRFNGWRQKRFAERLATRTTFEASNLAIRQFVSESLEDIPSGRGVEGKSLFSWVALQVHRIAAAHGWNEETILALPLKRLWQYLRIIRLEQDRKAILSNAKSDAIVGNFLTLRNRLKRAQREEAARQRAAADKQPTTPSLN